MGKLEQKYLQIDTDGQDNAVELNPAWSLSRIAEKTTLHPQDNGFARECNKYREFLLHITGALWWGVTFIAW